MESRHAGLLCGPHNNLLHADLGGGSGLHLHQSRAGGCIPLDTEDILWTLHLLDTRFLVFTFFWGFCLVAWASLPPLFELSFLSWTNLLLESWPFDLCLQWFLVVTYPNFHGHPIICLFFFLTFFLLPFHPGYVSSLAALLAAKEHKTWAIQELKNYWRTKLHFCCSDCGLSVRQWWPGVFYPPDMLGKGFPQDSSLLWFSLHADWTEQHVTTLRSPPGIPRVHIYFWWTRLLQN